MHTIGGAGCCFHSGPRSRVSELQKPRTPEFWSKVGCLGQTWRQVPAATSHRPTSDFRLPLVPLPRTPAAALATIVLISRCTPANLRGLMCTWQQEPAATSQRPTSAGPAATYTSGGAAAAESAGPPCGSPSCGGGARAGSSASIAAREHMLQRHSHAPIAEDPK